MGVSVGVAKILVARKGPLARKRAPAFLPLIPVTLAGGRSADDEFADLARCDLAAGFVDDLQFVAGDRLAGRAETHGAGLVAQERLKHLGRTDAVEHFDAARLAPALAEILRQRFAGGNTQTQPVGAGATAHMPMRQQ